jgi:hypothetical protein
MALVIACQAFAQGLALAQPPPVVDTGKRPARHRVLVITEDPNDPFMTRVQAEVSAIPGMEVTIQRPLGSLDADARAEHAEVAIRKVPSGKGVEVWMADATTGRSLLRQLVVDESPNGPDQGLVALQTAELLRTALLAKAAPTPASPPPAPPVTPPSAPPAPPARDSAVLVGVGPLASTGGVSPSWQVWVSYQRLLSDHFGFSLDASAPLHRGSISSAQGHAHLGAVVVGGGLLARLQNEQATVAGTATLGAAFASVLTKGEAKPSYLDSSITTNTGLAYLRLGIVWNPTPWLGLGVAGLVGTTTSRIHIRFAESNVGTWGTPVMAAILCGGVVW